MWKLLSDSTHVKVAETFAVRAAVLRPFLKRLVPVLQALSARPYANLVYGYWSHATFLIGTAPQYGLSHPPHLKILCIEGESRGFLIGCGESRHSEWGVSNGKRIGCWTHCTDEQVVSIVDRIVERELSDFAQSEPGD